MEETNITNEISDKNDLIQDETGFVDAEEAVNVEMSSENIGIMEEERVSEGTIGNKEIESEIEEEHTVNADETEKKVSTEGSLTNENGLEEIVKKNEEDVAISLPAPTSGYKNDISVFCITQQGEAHIKNNIPCQDRSEFRWIDDKILIAAIADGVGSCQLSDYGAETAVKSSLEFLEQFFKVEIAKTNFVFDTPDRMKTALSGAMQHAYDAVEKRADELNILSYSLQSTLTVAVYDGITLYFAHAGDDGIVALNKEGIYAMVTSRIKGEEASSVYPLQSKQWFYGKVNEVVAFVMATDGVLDAFVRPASEDNRVYYRFVEPVFYTLQTDAESAKLNCADWDEYLKSYNYRKAVTDDITLVGVVNQKSIQSSQKPEFDDKAWNDKTDEYEKKRKAALYPPQSKKGHEEKKKDNNVGIEKAAENNRTPNYINYNSKNAGDSTNQNSVYSNKFYTNGVRNIWGSENNTSPKKIDDLNRINNNSNSQIVTQSSKQIVEKGIDFIVDAFGVGGLVLSATGKYIEINVEKLKQSRAQKSQQTLNTDYENNNTSTKTN